jgi:hypothetical protein
MGDSSGFVAAGAAAFCAALAIQVGALSFEQEALMQTHQYQLTLYMPDDAAQPAVALPKPDRPRVKELSIREAAIQYLGELPDGEKPVTRLLHYGAGALATDELLACVFSANGKGHADAQYLLNAFEGLPGLACATIYELQQHPGIGPARTAQVKAALERGRRSCVVTVTAPSWHRPLPPARYPLDVHDGNHAVAIQVVGPAGWFNSSTANRVSPISSTPLTSYQTVDSLADHRCTNTSWNHRIGSILTSPVHWAMWDDDLPPAVVKSPPA